MEILRLFRVMFSCVAISFVFASSGCDTNESKSQLRSSADIEDPRIMQPQGNGTVNVTIAGLTADQNATIFRVDANHRHKVHQLDASQLSNPLKLQSGFYLVGIDGSHCMFPIPALIPFLTSDATHEGEHSLHVRLQTYPELEEKWAWIPRGYTVLGDTLGVGREDERPVRIEEIAGFWIGRFEVTNKEFAEFLSAIFTEEGSIPESWIDLQSRKCRISFDGKVYTTDAPTLPVVMVSLAGAQAFCEQKSKETGQVHRLPSESEWEKAARGPEMFVYSYGNIYKQSSANQESGKLKPVGSYAPNSWGLYDMTGNAFEWMSNVADPEKKDTTLNHSLRGGSFVLDGMYLRNSFRMRQSPGVMTDDIGFRVVREAKN